MPETKIKQKAYRFADFVLNSDERILLRSGKRVLLTPRAFDLLLVLVAADGHLLSKETRLERVWADAIVEEGNLNRTISALRKALGDARGQSRFIETVPKAGYRFIATVETVSENGSRLPGSKGMDSLPTSAPSAKSNKWIIGVAAFILLFGTLAGVFLLVPNRARVSPGPSGLVRLTNSQFDEDQAHWTMDNQIRFVRFVTSSRAESWVMNADGSNQRRANEQIKSLLSGGWSPDGKQVVFIKDGETAHNVYLAYSDGSNERKLPLIYPPNDWSPDGTKLVYSSVADGANQDIFVYDIATDKSTNITNSPAFDVDPLFSPDGSQVIFVSDRDGNGEDYVVNIDGTNVRRVTRNIAKPAFPVFSPDGTQFIFASNREGENIDIYVQNVNDDSPPIKITDLPTNEEHRGNCWSPDGTKMVITSDKSGKSNIYVLDVEPYKPNLFLADPEADLQSPAFSRDGSKMAYQAKDDDNSFAVRVMDVSSKVSKSIFRTEGKVANLALSPVFSPDGRRIAFTNKSGGNTEIFTIDIDGGAAVNLTNNSAADVAPDFSPDGREIAFQSNRDGNFERFHIFRMNADGTEQRRVTEREGYEFTPVFLPSGESLVFSGDRGEGGMRASDVRVLDLKEPNAERVVVSRRLHDSQPAISPDGKLIVFVAQSDGNSELYLVKTDGTGLVRLTRNAADDLSPRFSADERSIYFSSNRSGKFAIYFIDLKVASG